MHAQRCRKSIEIPDWTSRNSMSEHEADSTKLTVNYTCSEIPRQFRRFDAMRLESCENPMQVVLQTIDMLPLYPSGRALDPTVRPCIISAVLGNTKAIRPSFLHDSELLELTWSRVSMSPTRQRWRHLLLLVRTSTPATLNSTALYPRTRALLRPRLAEACMEPGFAM